MAYALSYRNIEEMLMGRDILLDHSTLDRRALHFSPRLKSAFHKRKQRPGSRVRMSDAFRHLMAA